MKVPPVFFDPGQQRWGRFKRGIAIALVLAMMLLCALSVSIMSLPTLSSLDPNLPQATSRLGPVVAHPAGTQPGGLQQQLQQAIVALNQLVATARVTTTSLPTLVPANLTPIPQVNPTTQQNQFIPPVLPTPTAGAINTATLPPPPTQVQPTATQPIIMTLAPTSTQGKGRFGTQRPTATNVQAQGTPTPPPPQSSTSTPVPTNPQKHGGTPTSAPTKHGHKATPAAYSPETNLASLFAIPLQNIAHLFSTFYQSIFDLASPGGPASVSQISPSRKPLIIGFYVNWDDNGDSSLQQNMSYLDRFMPEWLHLANANGAIMDDNINKENDVLNLIREKRPDLAILPLVNSYNPQTGQWNSQALGQMLNDPAARTTTIQNLLQYVQKNHLAGISIDFEDTPPESQPGLQAFMQAIYTAFHPLGLEVVQVIPLTSSLFDLHAYAQTTDYLILVAYDEHWGGGKAGPIASQGWFESSLKQQLTSVDPQKIIIAVGNYGYDWGPNTSLAQTLSFEQAVQTASTYNAAIKFDPTALNPTFTYTDHAGHTHTVWYLDAVTAYNQIKVSLQAQVRGFALWRLGSEDPSIWPMIAQLPGTGAQVVESLKTLSYGYQLTQQGQGEVLKISGVPQPGMREITQDPNTGLLISEKMVSYPSTYIISRWGQKSKEIALTFDDGPNPPNTNQILDILKKYQVPATFFIIGEAGEQHLDLLHQIEDSGCEIGVHTFTHPDISTISIEQLRLELNATQLLLESQLGVSTLLFRPPYAIDEEPETPAQVAPLVVISQLGYYTIGMQIDPSDWEKPGTQAIIDRTVSQVVNANGNIIVLHDGGGDRSQTVAALPAIIETLRAKGYRFVLVSDLLGLTRDQVMPPVPGSHLIQTGLGLVGFSVLGFSSNALSVIFLVLTIIGVGRMILISILSLIQWIQSDNHRYPSGYQPKVSVLVPAYNEAKVINKTVLSLLKSTYPNQEIIIIDDGSTDGTAACVLKEYPDQPGLRVFSKPNGGKAHALNYGLQQAAGDIIVVLDADTVLLPQAITQLVRHMGDPRVGAVAGNAKVGNRINLITRMQALEYITSQNMDRRAFALLNCITVVPGAIGAWRKDTILEVGGFKSDTLAEDADLTLNILRKGVRIEYEESAIALTEAPDNLRSFLKQRFRWMFGMLQVFWKQKNVLFNPRYRGLGLVALPNILVFSIIIPIISPIFDLTFVGSLITWALYRVQHPEDLHLDYLTIIIGFYVFFLVVDLLASTLSFVMESRENWRLILLLFPQRLFYRQLMYYTSIRSILSAIRGQVIGWGKLERKASVKL